VRVRVALLRVPLGFARAEERTRTLIEVARTLIEVARTPIEVTRTLIELL